MVGMAWAAVALMLAALVGVAHAQNFLCYDTPGVCSVGGAELCFSFACPLTKLVLLEPYDDAPMNPSGSCFIAETSCLNSECDLEPCSPARYANDWTFSAFASSLPDDLSCDAVCGALEKTCNLAGTLQAASPTGISTTVANQFAPVPCNSFVPFVAPGLTLAGCTFPNDVASYSCDVNPVDFGANPENFFPICCCGDDCPLVIPELVLGDMTSFFTSRTVAEEPNFDSLSAEYPSLREQIRRLSENRA
ncbi:hypothetical protein FVE85_5904 [Porphyridium purpureum]|uniref:Uncharacterized protein n=1 Tax=Porphyridium purpureum TaxID=35688 RepID=A0A5J4Z2X3_PORPP|nr:hypothetical protein FVE85_5904 [Porphyridium purpureum]|eukprot:POR2560..scf295_1